MADRPDTSMNAAIIEEFRARDGKVGGHFEGAKMLLLHTTGAKSGARRTSPLMYFGSEHKILIVGSYAGADVHPAWVYNLRAHPAGRIEIGTDEYAFTASELPPGERDQAFSEIIAAAPFIEDYQAKTTRTIPVFELKRA